MLNNSSIAELLIREAEMSGDIILLGQIQQMTVQTMTEKKDFGRRGFDIQVSRANRKKDSEPKEKLRHFN